MLSKPLIYTVLVFQIIGLVWDAFYHFTDPGGIGEFFAAAHWPVFLGFVILLIAVLQSFPKKKEPNEDNKFLP
ncbi:MAG: hypothetical protein A3H72_02180 [Candidatus Doudnabacteria bacterium RIFCSPLOWO2_02_FULL_48_8]|uniref:Uncharacterized protein n=1 Tax=Candidatus Doudnabacteria bacterium RIFCSPHIGHO2_01_FULL_46_24 TaxID=1817825 RepID=A0A1F5NSQ2_9BACT|nr:MAG: hypothetical protein A2720_04000 [Candidatus Doudnabacteria bacterium RIFCSPHIGHO2_01_FULL_46_24]OGE94007.1 MAG: hypothetical protein A3E98_04450 [Candidatus Doudnabacteria bacterium RIFCSPHIGHO2_12_FULL_48_11]OGE95215.1 MAG: hypothetical protein A3H72_02180 [Candidatus Doudnabacteria bacterium RIFCSPLOWO2_02_FULL_48_8]